MKSQSHWRNTAAPIIEKVLSDNKGKSLKEIKRALILPLWMILRFFKEMER